MFFKSAMYVFCLAYMFESSCSLTITLKNRLQWRSVTSLASAHTGPYGFKITFLHELAQFPSVSHEYAMYCPTAWRLTSIDSNLLITFHYSNCSIFCVKRCVRWLIEINPCQNPKTRPRIQNPKHAPPRILKHFPGSKNTSQSPKHFPGSTCPRILKHFPESKSMHLELQVTNRSGQSSGKLHYKRNHSRQSTSTTNKWSRQV